MEVKKMAKTDVLHVRVEPSVKTNAEATLSQLGMSISEAINVFLRQVVLKGGLPFEVVLPKYNEVTLRAMKESLGISRSDEKGITDVDELFKELDS